MQEKTLKLEIANQTKDGKIYYGLLELPASDLEIEDAMQQIRSNPERPTYTDISAISCRALRLLEGKRLDTPSIRELNFFAQRLTALSAEELSALQAVAPKFLSDDLDNYLPISMKTLINLTYGLDKVTVTEAVRNDHELGQHVIDNDLHPDIAALPEDSLRFIDRREAGAWLREQEGGVYIDGKYIVTGEYRYTEIYDGITLPEQGREDRYVFRIGIAAEEKGEAKQWISLPAMRLEADRIAKSFGVEKIENCACVGFESAIPQIEEKDIRDLSGFAKLNFIASQYIKMSPAYRMKYKAVLYRRDRFDLDYALESLRQLDRYELDPGVEYADDYFREYLCRHLDARFDTEWLDNMNLQREGQTLKEKTGTKLTPYGAVSAPDHSLYKNVLRREQIDFREERMEAVELFGQKALFIDRRIKPNEIAEGLYKYELREAENGEFATIEERVAVNFAGTILTKTPIHLGRDGYRDLDEETSPNFLGYEQTMREYMDEQDQTEQQTEGVITQ